MRQRPQLVTWIVAGVVLSLLLPTVGSVAVKVSLPDAFYEHVTFHAVLEAACGMMALAMAGILLAERRYQEPVGSIGCLASALTGMGVLDLFHAATLPTHQDCFVWLRSAATLVGGLLSAGVWLPARVWPGWLSSWMATAVGLVMLSFGVLSCLFPAVIPAMVGMDGEFTPVARLLNGSGGSLFLLAAGCFVWRFHHHLLTRDWLFAVYTCLLGTSGILFEISRLWDASWWWWHALRLIGSAAALVFAASSYLQAYRTVFALNADLQQLNRNLDRQVEKRTADLRASEERYELAVRGSTDGLWDWNVLTGEVYYAQRFKELLGYADEEFPNRFASFELHLHPDDHAATMAAVQAHLARQIPYDVSYRLRTKSGVYRWFRARGQALWSSTGQATRMSGSITDVTSSIEAEASLRKERFLFRTLLEHLPDAIYFKDQSGRFLRVSQALVQRLGATDPEQVIGRTDADFFPAEYAAQARQDEETLMHSGQPLVGKEEQPRWANAEESWVSTTKVPLYDESGAVIGTFGISHDITAQKQAEERFRQVIEATPCALLVVDRGGRIQLVNAAAERIFGYRRDELVGRGIELLVPPEMRVAHARFRDNYFSQPEARAMAPGRPLSACRKDGSLLPVEVGLSPIWFGSETLALGSVLDVSVRVEAERALVSAKEAAEAANRAKSDFLANMSHEIRTPMNAILGMTELVLDTELNLTQREYLAIVLESAESLLSIINEILDFAKIEAGKLELQMLDFDLREELGSTMKSLGPRAHFKELELAWRVAADVPAHVTGDPLRLRQILVNLTGNAIKFTSRGEVVVEVHRERPAAVPPDRDGPDVGGQEAPRETVVPLHFTVRDTGIGIPVDKLPAIFNPFEQVDSSTTRLFGGTGLGLSIASRLIAALGGRIWVESAVGQGSTFHFTLPLRLGKLPVATGCEPPDLEKMPVIVVDDNSTNRLILKEMIESWGLTVYAAATGDEALQWVGRLVAQGGPRPLLLTDVNMPRMDGFMLVERIRRQPESCEIPIIMLTSGGRPGDVERCENLSVCTHLIKPVKQSELLDAILLAVGRQGSYPAPHAAQLDLPRIPPLHILLAEDGKANQKLATGLLKKWGHDVVVAENGQEAVERSLAEPFDVILMDVQMPVMDGLQATRTIREHERQTGQHIPILAMTARAMKGDRERCLRAGMDDYIAKPVRKQELYRALKRFYEVVGGGDTGGHEIPGGGSPRDEPQVTVDPSEGAGGASNRPPADMPAEPSGALIDWPEARRRTVHDEHLLREVAQEARRELPRRLLQLKETLDQRDLAAAARHAHTMCGTCDWLGAQQVVQITRAVQAAAKRGDQNECEVQLVPLQEVVVELLRELDDFLGTVTSA